MLREQYRVQEIRKVTPWSVVGSIMAIAVLIAIAYWSLNFLLNANKKDMPPATDPNVQMRQPAPATEAGGKEKNGSRSLKLPNPAS